VIDFLEDMAASLKSLYPDVSNLKWNQIRLLEKFRSIQEKPRTVAEIRTILQAAGSERAYT
jgi:hypothetical protein